MLFETLLLSQTWKHIAGECASVHNRALPRLNARMRDYSAGISVTALSKLHGCLQKPLTFSCTRQSTLAWQQAAADGSNADVPAVTATCPGTKTHPLKHAIATADQPFVCFSESFPRQHLLLFQFRDQSKLGAHTLTK